MQAREQDIELVSTPFSTNPRGHQGTALILGQADQAEGGAWLVEDAGQPRAAKRAASCLLEPAVGDQVWIVVEGERCYVLAVLERAAEQTPASLRIEGDAALHVEGRLEIHAADDLQLRSAAEVGVAGEALQVQARTGRVFVGECKAVLRSLVTHATRSTLVSKLVETLADRVQTSSKTSARTVVEIDELHAGVIDHRASELAQLAGDKVIVNGGEIAKVEAGQIHLG
ncbi:DUF3540 domain-containing protein [Pseudenhygromyxa sp. WMMC2535]|uniref:DUF3540 domain-containing protein n=1 Tax=Pseudenhygromyxa sp. WMMC2535 TaxID=2712867 RepID=UPI001558019E|nr:DUF3540 domain-containing protein [Pseudenhygromyxa sp. WMMC2535]NVB42446.1 DUF3540 domain-containing protein [Pseudenhygromyxa sp. WMMC2535]